MVTPLTSQVTDVFVVFPTLTLNCVFPPASTLVELGLREMVTELIEGGVRVTVALAVLEGCAWDAAVTYTVLTDGNCGGAVYMPPVVTVPRFAFPPG